MIPAGFIFSVKSAITKCFMNREIQVLCSWQAVGTRICSWQAIQREVWMLGMASPQDTMQLVRSLQSSVAVQNNARWVVVEMQKWSLVNVWCEWSYLAGVLLSLWWEMLQGDIGGPRWDGKGWLKSIKRFMTSLEVTIPDLESFRRIRRLRNKKEESMFWKQCKRRRTKFW